MSAGGWVSAQRYTRYVPCLNPVCDYEAIQSWEEPSGLGYRFCMKCGDSASLSERPADLPDVAGAIRDLLALEGIRPTKLESGRVAEVTLPKVKPAPRACCSNPTKGPALARQGAGSGYACANCGGTYRDERDPGGRLAKDRCGCMWIHECDDHCGVKSTIQEIQRRVEQQLPEDEHDHTAVWVYRVAIQIARAGGET